MEEKLQAILEAASKEAVELNARPDFEAFKARLVGPHGSLTDCVKSVGKLPKEERPLAGKAVNQIKKALEALFTETLQRIETAEMQALLGPAVDPSLPSAHFPAGTRHPLSQVRDAISEIFRKIGFTIAEGSELESEWYCFDALNTPDDHPARDEQDTLFLPEGLVMGNVDKKADERYVMRTHTSPVQIRTLLKEEPPLRIVAPGRAFRRDTVDATHSANFHQIEGLYVEKDCNVTDLKAVLDYFLQELFGSEVQTRLRPSFFPFTEPSFELDMKLPNLGKLSDQWIEVMGCGMVDPEVFKSVGYDPEAWSGYAFGMGIERLAMLLYGVDDIRYFYQNDLRFLRQFTS
tara:strand:- start:10931 stop:11974 length:1044 start_codon:yes stop_codon:yes gene_type:complete